MIALYVRKWAQSRRSQAIAERPLRRLTAEGLKQTSLEEFGDTP